MNQEVDFRLEIGVINSPIAIDVENELHIAGGIRGAAEVLLLVGVHIAKRRLEGWKIGDSHGPALIDIAGARSDFTCGCNRRALDEISELNLTQLTSQKAKGIGTNQKVIGAIRPAVDRQGDRPVRKCRRYEHQRDVHSGRWNWWRERELCRSGISDGTDE